jgi:hypothetical protein
MGGDVVGKVGAKKRNVPDSKSHGTLARTALPQVLLKKKPTWRGKIWEWH